MSQPNVKSHVELSAPEITAFRNEVENLPPFVRDNKWQVAFDQLVHEDVIYVFRRNPDDSVQWVSYNLVYCDSGQDCNDLPDPEA